METDIYYYHSDHPGSSSWITSTNGSAIQHMQYHPFGETNIDQRAGDWNARYTFSGKEKDEETGYHYFGARYHNSGLGIWLSVDPMAGKYPDLSPYVYAANNPIRLVDPNGMSFEGWEINIQEKSVNQISTAGNNNTQYVNSRGVTQQMNMSTDDFVKQAQLQGYTVNTFSQTFDPISPSYSGTGFGWGVSLDGTLSLGKGYSFEVGYVEDASGNGSMFYSHGKTGGFEASIGANGFIIPNSNFNLSDFKDQSMSINVNYGYLNGGILTDHRPGAVNDYYYNNYGGLKFGGGLGVGASISHTKTTFFQMPKRDNTNIPIYYQRGHK